MNKFKLYKFEIKIELKEERENFIFIIFTIFLQLFFKYAKIRQWNDINSKKKLGKD